MAGGTPAADAPCHREAMEARPTDRTWRRRRRRPEGRTLGMMCYVFLAALHGASSQDTNVVEPGPAPAPDAFQEEWTALIEEVAPIEDGSVSTSPPIPTAPPSTEPLGSSPPTTDALDATAAPSTSNPPPATLPPAPGSTNSTTTTEPTHSPSLGPSLFPSAIPSAIRSTPPSSTKLPSLAPTSSFMPTVLPSHPPSLGPTHTRLPSIAPSQTSMPSFPPSQPPSLSPVIAPSSAPSLEEELRYARQYIQRLTVSVPQSFALEQVAIFQFLYQQYTEEFGYQVGEPSIVTECLVLSQQIGINSVRGARGGLFHRGVRRVRGWVGGITEVEYDEDDRRLLESRLHYSTVGSARGKWSRWWKRDKYGGYDHHNHQRRMQTAPPVEGYPLTLRFTMEYTTRVGVYDIADYNQLFAEYINANLPKVVDDLALLGLPVVGAGDVLLLKDKGPTTKPTLAPVMVPTNMPATERPTTPPTLWPTSLSPTALPSAAPSEEPPFIDVDVTDNSFVLGLSLGLTGAFLISAGALLYYRHAEARDADLRKRMRERSMAGGNGSDGGSGPSAYGQSGSRDPLGGNCAAGSGDGMESGSASRTVELTPGEEGHLRDDHNLSGNNLGSHIGSHHEMMDDGEGMHPPTGSQYPPHDVENGNVMVQTSEAGMQPWGGENVDSIFTTSSTSPDNTTADSMGYSNMFALPYQDEFSQGERGPMPQSAQAAADQQWIGQPGMMVHDASFSSGSSGHLSHPQHDELFDPSNLDGSQDELDNYRNNDLETLRTAVENAVDGAEGMMSLAVTRALTEPEETSMESLPWAGAQGNGSIEACCLCETYDWLKRNENDSLESIHEYFQAVLNRIVITVMFGMASPMQGAHLAHACATILGLDLLTELPETTLVITGMRKTNDLTRGHNFIVKAFKPFGKVEEAAIAPGNRGFGFVRFAKPESVKRALKKYREAEIEIQDVSVSIKTLKSERPR